MNSAEQAKKVVIIGAGHGGGRTAITLREAGYSGEITILGTEESLPYERPGLSKGFLQGEEKVDDLYLQPSSWYGDNDVTRRTGVEVTNIDPQGRQVTFRETARNSSNGSDDVLSEEQSYETLVLATGSEPRKLDLAGAGAQNICYLRSIDDSQRLRSQLAQAQRVAIIGAGWIGLEVAAAARRADCAVTVLNREAEPLIGPLGETLAKMFGELHLENGVTLRNNTSVSKLIMDGDRIVALETDAGDQIGTDLVVAGIGVTPRLSLVADLDLQHAAGGIAVDAQLRSSDPNIYAVGDIAAVYNEQFDRHIRLEHWAGAMRHPDTLAEVLCGRGAKYDRLPYFFTDQYDLGSEYVGYVPPEVRDDVEVVVRGDMRSREFIAFYLLDHKILAGMNINIWDVSEDIEKLIMEETPVTRDELEDSNVALSDLARR